MLADVTAPEKRGATFGLMGAAFGLGFILGPAIGGLLAGFGTRAPFIAAASLAGLNALWIAFAPAGDAAARTAPAFRWRDANIFGAFRPLFHAGGAGALLVAALLWQLGHNVYPATWAFWAGLALHWNAAQIGWSLAAAGLAMALAQAFVTGRAIARFGEARTVVIGMVVGGLSFLAYVFVTQSWMVYRDHLLQRAAGPRLAVDQRLALADDRRLAPGRAAGRDVEHRQHRRDHRAAGDDPGARLRRRARRAGRRLPARGPAGLSAPSLILLFGVVPQAEARSRELPNDA